MTNASTPTATHISPQMREAVGRELGRAVSFPVSESDIRKWAIAVYFPEEPPARFIRPADGQPMAAPEDFNPFAWCVAESHVSGTPVEDNTAPDRTEMQLGIPGPGLVNQLNGGVRVEYGVPILAGDVITSVSRVGGYSERNGRMGLMLFTDLTTTWTNQRGEAVKTSTTTLIRY